MPDGHCLCGATRWRFTGPLNWTGFCHCESCRRNCAAPVAAFIGVPNGAWDWTGQVPGTYQHTSHATRFFCTTCGTPMAYASTRYPDEIHFYAASLSEPQNAKPTAHFHHAEKLDWLHLADDLPKPVSSQPEDTP